MIPTFFFSTGTLSGRDRWLEYVAQMYAHMPDYKLYVKDIILEEDGSIIEENSSDFIPSKVRLLENSSGFITA
jgi:hypothetical protein